MNNIIDINLFRNRSVVAENQDYLDDPTLNNLTDFLYSLEKTHSLQDLSEKITDSDRFQYIAMACSDIVDILEKLGYYEEITDTNKKEEDK
jgi:hypothetical protein